MSTVKLHIISPDTSSERVYDLSLTVQHLKQKLELVTGIPPDSQILSLCKSEEDQAVLRLLDDDSKPLGYYGLENYMLIKVTDKDPSRSQPGQYTDVSQVEKFELSPEEYEKRRDTVLQYKKVHQMGRFAPAPEASGTPPPAPSHHIVVGSRCEVEASGDDGITRRGTIRFVGSTKFAKGEWVGIEYDEPAGKNDGSIQGERYFTCKPKYGSFVRPEKVRLGDFPIVDIEEEEI